MTDNVSTSMRLRCSSQICGSRRFTESGRRATTDGERPVQAASRARHPPDSEAYEALVVDRRLPEPWPEYLVLQHAIIRATVPLTRAALTRSRELAEPDPLRRPLELPRWHVDEELGHDETLLDDLGLLGLGVRPPSSVCRAGCRGTRREPVRWILHYHPVSFLGYVGVMEGYPPPTSSSSR